MAEWIIDTTGFETSIRGEKNFKKNNKNIQKLAEFLVVVSSVTIGRMFNRVSSKASIYFIPSFRRFISHRKMKLRKSSRKWDRKLLFSYFVQYSHVYRNTLITELSYVIHKQLITSQQIIWERSHFACLFWVLGGGITFSPSFSYHISNIRTFCNETTFHCKKLILLGWYRGNGIFPQNHISLFGYSMRPGFGYTPVQQNKTRSSVLQVQNVPTGVSSHEIPT